VLVDVYGVGILLLGKSGIGKSECALELIMRGHRIVADDIVRCDWRPPGLVFGQPAELLRHHLEIRGLGVLDIRELFGVTAVRERKRIDLVVHLCEWNEREEFDRLGIEDHHHHILDTPIRELRVPVRSGRNMGSIIEMAARNELMRRAGRHTAHEFLERIEGRLVTRPALESEATAGYDPTMESTSPPTAGARSKADGASPANGARPEPDGASPANAGARSESDGAGKPTTWSSLVPAASGTESSAWVPVARPRKESEE
jgi:HPr kinase/phosphorylase